MSPIRMWGLLGAAAVLGIGAGPLRAGECEATAVCWHRCQPTVRCYEPCPCRCGPIRRLLGLCRPVVVCHPVVVPVTGCAPACPPATVLPATPAPVAVPTVPAPVSPAVEPPRYSPNPNLPAIPPSGPPATGSSYRPLPAPPLTPPLAPAPVRLDRFVSYPGN
jgi:hypothetical protein